VNDIIHGKKAWKFLSGLGVSLKAPAWPKAESYIGRRRDVYFRIYFKERHFMEVYLNNAATSWPKPGCVAEAAADFLTSGGANLGRGTSSRRDLATLNRVLDCRIKIAKLFDGRDPRYVTFCSGVTEALNVVIKGFYRKNFINVQAGRGRSAPGGSAPEGSFLPSQAPSMMRVLSTSMEHNAVVRPLRGLEKEGVETVFLRCEPDGALDLGLLEEVLSEEKSSRGKFHLMVLSHASNVCGTIQPLEGIAELCRRASLPLVLDSAQTAGILPISLSKLGLAALCFTGHKGLMGPQGIGGILWDPDFAAQVAPLVEGGTGSFSHVETQPSDMPDKFEAGTPNLPGIAALDAALGWLEERGIEEIRKHENQLGERFLDRLTKIGGILYGKPAAEGMKGRLSVFAVNFPSQLFAQPDLHCKGLEVSGEPVKTSPGPNEPCASGEDQGVSGGPVRTPPGLKEPCPSGEEQGVSGGPVRTPPGPNEPCPPELQFDNGILANELSLGGFETRPGLHCAPLAHKTLGSFPGGSLRVSPGYFNTLEDIDKFFDFLEAAKECKKCTGRS
jgi:selenocysteine lyase/cysteine desulfurase